MDARELCPEAWEIVSEFFRNEPWKADLWFKTPNPLLGWLSPTEMAMQGRCEKLVKFARTATSENKRGEAEASPQKKYTRATD